MLLRQIKYFVTVVDCHSFTEAAEQCYISQSAISQQVKALESELGVTLLRRENRSFTVTPAGEYLYNKGKALLMDSDIICREILQIANRSDEHLVIGLPVNYAGSLLYKAIDRFAALHPGVSLDIVHKNHDELYTLLQSGKVDVALTDVRRLLSDEYAAQYIMDAYCYIEIGVRHPLANEKQIIAEDFIKYPCVLISTPDYQYMTKEQFRYYCGSKANFIFAGGLEEARSTMFTGKGMLPLFAEKDGVRFDNKAMANIPFYVENEPLKLNYNAHWKLANDNKAIKGFLKVLQDIVLAEADK